MADPVDTKGADDVKPEDKDVKVIPDTNDTDDNGKPADVKPDDKAGDPPVDTGDDTGEDGDASGEGAEDRDDAPEFDPEKWGDTGDETGNSVLRLLNEGGATPDEAKALVYDAVSEGKPENIDKAALIEKVGKDRANLIMAGITNFVRDRKDKAEAGARAIYDAAGGKENWDKMLPWVNKLPDADRKEYISQLDAGGLATKLAVQDLVQKYNADPKNKALEKQEIIGDANRAVQKVEGISQREYGDKLLALQRRNAATPEARAELMAQRRAGRKAGL